MQKREKDVSPKHLQAAAQQLTLGRDVIHRSDAVGKIEEDKGRSEGNTSYRRAFHVVK
jgi:hypothetical protein